MAYDSETGGRRPRRALNRFRLNPFRPGPAPGLWTLTLAVGLATALLAPLTLTAPQFLTLFLGGALAGGLVGMLPWSLSETRSLDSTEALLDSARKAEAGAVFAVAAGVLVEGLGTYGWAVVLSAVAAYPLLRLALERLPRPAARVAAVQSAAPAAPSVLCAPPLEECSTSELAASWGASHDLMQATSSPLMRARLAALRAEYLDELERRDHAGVQRWLASGAHAAGDLLRFLRKRDEGEEPTPDVL